MHTRMYVRVCIYAYIQRTRCYRHAITRGTEHVCGDREAALLGLSPLSPGWLIRETDAMPGDTTVGQGRVIIVLNGRASPD